MSTSLFIFFNKEKIDSSLSVSSSLRVATVQVSFFFFLGVCVWGFVNLWKDVMVTEDLVNLKKDGVSAEEAIDVKKGRKKKKDTLKQ